MGGLLAASLAGCSAWSYSQAEFYGVTHKAQFQAAVEQFYERQPITLTLSLGQSASPTEVKANFWPFIRQGFLKLASSDPHWCGGTDGCITAHLTATGKRYFLTHGMSGCDRKYEGLCELPVGHVGDVTVTSVLADPAKHYSLYSYCYWVTFVGRVRLNLFGRTLSREFPKRERLTIGNSGFHYMVFYPTFADDGKQVPGQIGVCRRLTGRFDIVPFLHD